ncbi:MAG: class I SAM-dependent methyltransferase [Acidimicrobiales bacterium]
MPLSDHSYTFGDTDVEAQRLAAVDEVFGPSSRALLVDAVDRPPALAYDLGCGPGHTTRLVAEATGARRTIGLDRSVAHLERAAAGDGGVSYFAHDVTQIPFPAGPADLVYCRLLLAHLPAPVEAAVSWSTQLNGGGFLVVDEIEWIESAHPLFREHLCLVQAQIAATGAQMCAGPILAGLGEAPGLRLRLGRVAEVEVPTASAATMFSFSLHTWGDQAVAAGLCDSDEMTDLRAGLAKLRESTATGEITWGLHQAAYEVVSTAS